MTDTVVSAPDDRQASDAGRRVAALAVGVTASLAFGSGPVSEQTQQ